MPTLAQINIYPIKSLGGIRSDSARLTDRGLQHDRRWMLVDEQGKFLTQRTVPMMSQLVVGIDGDKLHVQNRRQPADNILIPMAIDNGQARSVTVFKDTVAAVAYGQEINHWFSKQIDVPCELVFMPDNSDRPVDPKFSVNNEQVSFADGYQTLIAGESSLADLNSRLGEPVTMDRFRPNLVFSGGKAFAEDQWQRIRISEVEFLGVKLCPRCVMTTVNPLTGEVGSEPLKTLSTYRKREGGAMFGKNLLHGSDGSIRIGDRIDVIESEYS